MQLDGFINLTLAAGTYVGVSSIAELLDATLRLTVFHLGAQRIFVLGIVITKRLLPTVCLHHKIHPLSEIQNKQHQGPTKLIEINAYKLL